MTAPLTIKEARKLSPEEINKRIAEALGWKPVSTQFSGTHWYDPQGLYCEQVSDYFHDLNACFEAEKELTEHEIVFQYSVSELLGHNTYKCRSWISIPANMRAIALAVVLSSRNQPKG